MLEPLDALVVVRWVPWRRGVLSSCAMATAAPVMLVRRVRLTDGRAGALLMSPVLMVALGDAAAKCSTPPRLMGQRH